MKDNGDSVNTDPAATVSETVTNKPVFAFAESNATISSSTVTRPGSLILGDKATYGLGGALERPVQLLQGDLASISIDTTVSTVPLADILADPLVLSKINYFKCARFTLKMRLLINTSPFNFGRFYLVFLPYNTLTFANNLLYNFASFPNARIDPSSNAAVELDVPYFWLKPMFELTDGSASATNYGTINIVSVSALGNCNSASASATYTLYGWLDDVELRYETTKIVSVTNEIEKVKKGGSVSNISTRVAAAASMVGRVPGFAALAGPVEAAANAVTGIAGMFGLSRPIIPPDLTRQVIPRSINDVSTMVGAESLTRLSGDPLQATSVDASIYAGPPIDQMSFNCIKKYEGIIRKINWATTASAGNLLDHWGVTPMTYYNITGNATNTVPTSVGWIGNLFTYWTGPLVYRFDFVASPMMRGRVKITHSPEYVSTLAYPDNKSPSVVVDLSQTRTIDVVVGWCQSVPFLSTLGYDDGTSFSGQLAYNGALLVQVVNALEVPTGSATMQIIVTMRGHDETMFMQPNIQSTRYVSGTGSTVIPTGDAMSYPALSSVQEVWISGAHTNPNLIKVYGGEIIDSMRTYLKRYCMISRTINYLTTGGAVIRLPMYPPRVSASTFAGLTPKADVSNFTSWHWIMPGYTGCRGSTKWKVLVSDANPASPLVNDTFGQVSIPMIVSRVPAETAIAVTGFYALAGGNTVGTGQTDSFPQMALGGAISNDYTNQIEFEIPDYSPLNFTKVGSYSSTNVNTARQGANVALWTSYNTANNSNGQKAAQFSTFFSIGEDFTFVFYSGPGSVNTTNT